MTKITWTATRDGNKHTATNGNGMEIGRVTVSCATYSERPFWARSANGMRKRFFLLHHAKEWIEELYADVAEAIENAQ